MKKAWFERNGEITFLPVAAETVAEVDQLYLADPLYVGATEGNIDFAPFDIGEKNWLSHLKRQEQQHLLALRIRLHLKRGGWVLVNGRFTHMPAETPEQNALIARQLAEQHIRFGTVLNFVEVSQ